MKPSIFLILVIYILVMLFAGVDSISLELFKKFIMTNEKSHIESMIKNYKLQIRKYQEINNQLKEYKLSFKSSLLVLDDDKQRDNRVKKRVSDDEDELVLDIKFKNTTVINDMDLVIRNYKDKDLNLTARKESDDDVCFMKVTVPVNFTNKNESESNSNHSLETNGSGCKSRRRREEVNRELIRDYFKIRKIYSKEELPESEPKSYSNQTEVKAFTISPNPVTLPTSFAQIKIKEFLISNDTKTEHYEYKEHKEILNNTVINNNSTSLPANITNSTTTITFKMTNPSQEDVDIFTHFLKNSTVNKTKEEICNKCLDYFDYLDQLLNEVRAIKRDLKEFTNKTNSKQETIIKFSDYINRINLVKMELYQINFGLDVVKNAECSNYEKNNERYQGTLKRANLLIEVIQDSIRKQNLNINFVVIT